MNLLHDNYVLLIKFTPSCDERGIKKIINEISRRIKKLNKILLKEKTNDKAQKDLTRNTFEKIIVQMLFDGPDLTFSPSRYNKDENFFDILHNNILMCNSEDQRTNMLTLISIYKSLRIDERIIYDTISGMHEELNETILSSQHKDDLTLSKINDLQGYWRRKITIWNESMQNITNIQENWKRVQFLQDLKLLVCIQYWTKRRVKNNQVMPMITSNLFKD